MTTSPLERKSAALYQASSQSQEQRSSQSESPIYISSESEEFPSLEDLFAGNGTLFTKKKRSKNELSFKEKVDVVGGEGSSILGLSAKPVKTPYVKPQWIPPPKEWLTSNGLLNDEEDSNLSAILKEDMEARRQIAARESNNSSFPSASDVQDKVGESPGRCPTNVKKPVKVTEHETCEYIRNQPNKPTKSSLSTPAQKETPKEEKRVQGKVSSSKLRESFKTHGSPITESPERSNLINRVTKITNTLEEEDEGLQVDKKIKREDSEEEGICVARSEGVQNWSRRSASRTTSRGQPNVQTRASKKQSETPPPDVGVQTRSRKQKAKEKNRGN